MTNLEASINRLDKAGRVTELLELAGIAAMPVSCTTFETMPAMNQGPLTDTDNEVRGFSRAEATLNELLQFRITA